MVGIVPALVLCGNGSRASQRLLFMAGQVKLINCIDVVIFHIIVSSLDVTLELSFLLQGISLVMTLFLITRALCAGVGGVVCDVLRNPAVLLFHNSSTSCDHKN